MFLISCFSPILKFGSDNGKYYKREPWRWSIKTYTIVKDYLELRHKLVPYIYNEAYNYYLALFNAQKVNNNVEYKANVKEITIHAPKYKKKLPKLFDLDFEESKNEQEDL